jgi:protein SCO1/2
VAARFAGWWRTQWTTLLPLALVGLLTVALAQGLTVPTGLLAGLLPGQPSGLPRIGAAPAFNLTTQDGAPLSLSDLRGKVVLITFIYTSCTDTCPLLTGKLASLQAKLGADFGSRVQFLSVTVDPERDSPDVMRGHAQLFKADPAGWAFLTGTPDEVASVTGAYGIFVRKRPTGDVDHSFLTSLVDRSGTLRVQYVGTRFDPDELLADLRALVRER